MSTPPLPVIPNPTFRAPEAAVTNTLILDVAKKVSKRAIADATKPPKPTLTYVELFNAAEREGFKSDAKSCWAKLFAARRENAPSEYAKIAGPAFIAMQRELDGYLDADDPDVPYYLITVNPKDTVRFATLVQRLSKCLSKKWIRESEAYYCYCFEQRGTDLTHIHGYHAHFVLERPIILNGKRYKYAAFTREIRSTFRAIVGGDRAVDIRPIKEGTERTAINYVKGIKKDDEKQVSLEITKLWRRQIGIDDWTENFPFKDESFTQGDQDGDSDEEEKDPVDGDSSSEDGNENPNTHVDYSDYSDSEGSVASV